MEILIIILGVVVFIGGLIVYSTFSWGFVCYKFWAWFLLPIFPNLPVISFWQAVGLMFFIGLFKNTSTDTKKSTGEVDWGKVTSIFLAPWVALIVASFFH